MHLSKCQLVEKFPILEKFANQKWLAEEAVRSDCNYKKLPFMAALALMGELVRFCEETKFSSNWELCHSMKIRIQQIESLLLYFCEDTEQEKAIKGTDINQHYPIH